MKKITLFFAMFLLLSAANAQDAVVAPVNMNILYAGLSNPVEIAVPGVPADKVTATVTNGSIQRTANGWEIQVKDAGECIVSVYSDGKKVADKKFRIKILQPPVAMFSGKSTGIISKESIPGNARLEARIMDFSWDLEYSITGFTMLYRDGHEEKEISATGKNLTDDMKKQLSEMTRGESIIFKNITARGPDGRYVSLAPVILKID